MSARHESSDSTATEQMKVCSDNGWIPESGKADRFTTSVSTPDCRPSDFPNSAAKLMGAAQCARFRSATTGDSGAFGPFVTMPCRRSASTFIMANMNLSRFSLMRAMADLESETTSASTTT